MSCGKYRTRKLSLLYEFFDGISGWKFDKKHVRRCCTCTVFHQYEFLYVLSSVEQDGIFCDSSDIRMASHRCESFDVDEDFREE